MYYSSKMRIEPADFHSSKSEIIRRKSIIVDRGSGKIDALTDRGVRKREAGVHRGFGFALAEGFSTNSTGGTSFKIDLDFILHCNINALT